MSMHKIPLTADEREGLKSHGLDIGTPSQLSDVFRQGMAWANSKAAAECERLRAECQRLDGKYERDVWGLNNEGDAIGGEPAGGFANDLLRTVGERDAALAELAEWAPLMQRLGDENQRLRDELAALKGGQEAVAWAVCREPGKVDALSAAYASESAAKAHVNSYATKGCSGLHVTPLYTAQPAQASAWPEVEITGHLDEVDVPVWAFINAEARKLGPLTGSIDSYGLSRPNGATPNGGIVVLWNGQKIHAVALAVRDAMNRTQCVRLLAAPTPGASDGKGGDHE